MLHAQRYPANRFARKAHAENIRDPFTCSEISDAKSAIDGAFRLLQNLRDSCCGAAGIVARITLFKSKIENRNSKIPSCPLWFFLTSSLLDRCLGLAGNGKGLIPQTFLVDPDGIEPTTSTMPL
jgi:hypothetical protein